MGPEAQAPVGVQAYVYIGEIAQSQRVNKAVYQPALAAGNAVKLSLYPVCLIFRPDNINTGYLRYAVAVKTGAVYQDAGVKRRIAGIS